MKQILTTLLILTCIVGMGQTNGLIKDTTGWAKGTFTAGKGIIIVRDTGTITTGKGIIIVRDTGSMITIKTDSLWATDAINSDSAYFLHTRSFIDEKVYDTIPVMIMVCDTSMFGVLRTVEDTVLSDAGRAFIVVGRKEAYTQDDRTFWINGYQVREAYTYWGGPDIEPGQMMVYAVAVRRTDYKHIKYLDNKKQPLKPEIVVWDYRRRHTNSTSR